MFAVDDAAALGRQLVALHAAPEQLRAMADAGQVYARQRYDMRRYVREFEALYGELLSTAVSERAGAKGPRATPRLTWNVVMPSA
jgi:hypothetical protein